MKNSQVSRLESPPLNTTSKKVYDSSENEWRDTDVIDWIAKLITIWLYFNELWIKTAFCFIAFIGCELWRSMFVRSVQFTKFLIVPTTKRANTRISTEAFAFTAVVILTRFQFAKTIWICFGCLERWSSLLLIMSHMKCNYISILLSDVKPTPNHWLTNVILIKTKLRCEQFNVDGSSHCVIYPK